MVGADEPCCAGHELRAWLAVDVCVWCARMRKHAMGAFTVKITLLPVAVDGYRLRYATAHHAKLWNHNRSVYTKEYGSLSFAGCIDTGYFSHLSFTRDAVSFSHLKRNLPHRNKREKAHTTIACLPSSSRSPQRTARRPLPASTRCGDRLVGPKTS